MLQRTPVAHVRLVELKAGAVLQAGQAPFLQAHVVGIVQVVDAHHRVALIQQQAAHLPGDESGRSRHQVAPHYSLTTLGFVFPAAPRALRVSTINFAAFRMAG